MDRAPRKLDFGDLEFHIKYELNVHCVQESAMASLSDGTFGLLIEHYIAL